MAGLTNISLLLWGLPWWGSLEAIIEGTHTEELGSYGEYSCHCGPLGASNGSQLVPMGPSFARRAQLGAVGP